MRNAMQLKAIINNIAKEKGIRPQLALQNYICSSDFWKEYRCHGTETAVS